MSEIPKITSINASEPYFLVAVFDNGIKKKYNCGRLFFRPEFQLIQDVAFFKSAHIDPGGYGISWNDEIDISEYEIWNNGRIIS